MQATATTKVARQEARFDIGTMHIYIVYTCGTAHGVWSDASENNDLHKRTPRVLCEPVFRRIDYSILINFKVPLLQNGKSAHTFLL